MVLKWMWLSTEHPVIANSFRCLYLRAYWGEQFGDSISVRDADSRVVLCWGVDVPQDISAQGRGLEEIHGRDRVRPGPWRTGWMSPVGNVNHKAEVGETRMRLARRPEGGPRRWSWDWVTGSFIKGVTFMSLEFSKRFFFCLFEKANSSSNICKVF